MILIHMVLILVSVEGRGELPQVLNCSPRVTSKRCVILDIASVLLDQFDTLAVEATVPSLSPVPLREIFSGLADFEVFSARGSVGYWRDCELAFVNISNPVIGHIVHQTRVLVHFCFA